MKTKPKYCKHNTSCDAKKINHNCTKSSAKCLGGTENSIYTHCKNFKETK